MDYRIEVRTDLAACDAAVQLQRETWGDAVTVPSNMLFATVHVGAFIIRSGRCEVLQRRGGEQVRLGELGPGDFFGEMALLDEFPRSATVRAIEPTTCLGLTRWHFRGILESHPQIALAILPVLTKRLRNAERQATEAMRH